MVFLKLLGWDDGFGMVPKSAEIAKARKIKNTAERLLAISNLIKKYRNENKERRRI